MAVHNSFRTSERFAPFAIISNVRFSAACSVAVRFARSSKWLIFDTDLDSRMGMKRIQPSDHPRGGDCAPTGSFGMLAERNGGISTTPGEANAKKHRHTKADPS